MSESILIYKLPLYIVAALCIVGWIAVFAVVLFS